MPSPVSAVLIVAVALVTHAAPGHGQPPARGTVQGQISERERERPLAQSQVQVVDRPERVNGDESGRYQLQLPVGTHALVFRAVGMRPDTQRVTVTAGETRRLDVRLARAEAQLAATVITAQKRSQELQEVPLAVTAYDGDFLLRTNVQQFDELAYFVPNMNLQLQSPNNPSFSIRGITSDDGSAQVEPRVSVFADGVPMSKSRGSVVELFDMERIEVLKGPQGTLFGRGAQIGAIHLIQQKPTRERTLALRVGAGNFGERYVMGVANAPLASDKLFGRLAVIDNRRDGFLENRSGGRLLGKQTTAARASLRWLPTQRTMVDLIANYQTDTPPGTSFKSGSFAPAGGSTSPFTFADLESGAELGIDRQVYSGTLLVTQRLGDAWQLRSITAARGFTSDEAFDADGTRAPALRLNEIANGRQYSSELRAEYDKGGRFAGFVGASVFNESGSQRVPFQTDERSLWALITPIVLGSFPPATRDAVRPLFPQAFVNNGEPVLPTRLPTIPGTPFQGQLLKTNHVEQSENFGQLTATELFVDGTLRVTDWLSVTAGLRGTRESVDNALFVAPSATPGTLGAFLGAGSNNLFRPTNGRQQGTGSFNSWVGRGVVQVTPSKSLSAYASLSRGRRPNIIQLQFNATANAFRPVTLADETVISSEVGAKGTFWNGRVATDVALFRYDYNNFQTQVVVPNTAQPGQQLFQSRDDGAARASGAELSARAQATRAVTLFATYGYLDATFNDRDENGTPQRLAGNRFRLAPRHTWSVGTTLAHRWANRSELEVTPSYAWRGQHFFEELNQPTIQQAAYGLANLRATLTLPGGRVRVIGMARNLFDEEYIIDAGNTGGAFGIPTFIAGAPRFVSLQLSYGF
ncbi:MAG: TonB-dependent receptor [Gemmatimonadaceae bacterium]|jgi:outer membrane receptor protein involved in Fe transport|nr:TonB-dependent receptor [Gemmatimonadaceae bacterium]